MKTMVYIKQTACDDLNLKEFTEQWRELGSEGQTQLREWAEAEMSLLGYEIG